MKATLAHLALCDLEETLRHRITCFIGACAGRFSGIELIFKGCVALDMAPNLSAPKLSNL